MNKKHPPTIYEQVVLRTRKYFGPEAPGHIAKIVDIHLSKPPEELTKEELFSLLDWIRAAVSFLAADKKKIEKYIRELFELATGEKPPEAFQNHLSEELTSGGDTA